MLSAPCSPSLALSHEEIEEFPGRFPGTARRVSALTVHDAPRCRVYAGRTGEPRVDIEGPVVVSRRGEVRVETGHPWVYRSDVLREGGAGPGALVRVVGDRGKPLGFAFYSSRSEIRLRMVGRGEVLAEDFLRERIRRALEWRRSIAGGEDAYRLVHGEGDLVPSLVVDRYGEYLVVQTLSQGTERVKGEIVEILEELLHPRGVIERNDPKVRALEGLDQRVSVLAGEVPEVVEVSEGDVRLRVDLRRGQKTGLFLDQRRTTSPPGATPGVGCSTASATTGVSPCRWRATPRR